ncbi:MAG TPA: prolyl aminopeptidase [Legionellales bacterium]|nr:prolyl aminopeptidase [Legionellales bacterium]|tara:strand:+ start:255 stop:1193 length:939 start_codon:yes stop_codon:yes gene_type:complete
MHILYPAIKPYQTHLIAVDDTHTLYVEEVGNPDGIPALILHDGPGQGGDIMLRRFFDPQLFHMVIIDQRGAGRSEPFGEIKDNTTSLLVKDIALVCERLNLSRLVLLGIGFGALLALLFAQKKPDIIKHLVLSRPFLADKKALDWLYQQGANHIYPDYWQEFFNFVPFEQQNDVLGFYAKALQGNDEVNRMAAAKSFARWQAHCSNLHASQELLERFEEPHFALGLAMLHVHYIKHHYFMTDHALFTQMQVLAALPVSIIHGRYDMISPLSQAWRLHQALPQSTLTIIREAGHSDDEPSFIDALIGCTLRTC